MKGIREEEKTQEVRNSTVLNSEDSLFFEDQPEKSGALFETGIAKEWLNTREAANYLNTTDNALRILVCKRKVPFYKYGRHLRFRRNDLRSLLIRGV